MSDEKNDELQSRRQFFKKAAKATLPIIGAMAIAHLPIVANATETGCHCNYNCIGGCKGTCKTACVHSCEDGCKSTCKFTCHTRCVDTCSGSCSGSCRYQAKNN